MYKILEISIVDFAFSMNFFKHKYITFNGNYSGTPNLTITKDFHENYS